MERFSLRILATAAPWLIAGAAVAQTASLGSFDRRSEWVWQPVAIGAGGFVRGMVVHPLQSGNIRYARTDTYGAYRWDPLNGRWVNIINAANFPATLSVGTSNDANDRHLLRATPIEGGVDSIAIDPRQTSRLYLAMTVSPPGDVTGNVARQGNVYFSSNGGRSFGAATGLTLPSYKNDRCPGLEFDTQNTLGERLAVDPRNSNILYLGSQRNGVFLSSNAARSFAPATAPGLPTACQQVVNVLFDGREAVSRTINGRLQAVSRTIYIVVDAAEGTGVYRSSDGGLSFTNIAAGRDEIRNGLIGGSAIGPDGSFWIVGNGVVLRWRGNGWTALRSPRVPGRIAVDPGNPERLFVTGYDLQIARSNDGGQSWTDLGNYASIRSVDGIQWINDRVTHPTAHGAIFFDPSVSTAAGGGRLWAPQGNDGTMYADLNDAVQTGPAHGLDWKAQSRGIEQLVGQNIVIPPGGGNVAVVAAEDEPTFFISNPRLFTARRFDIDTAAQGNNDLAVNGMVAYVPDTPAVMVTNPANLFAGDYRGGPFRNNFAGYSVNYGRNWTLFPSIRITSGDNSYGGGSITNAPERLVGGQIAISARGTLLPGRGEARWTGQDNIVWFPFGAQYGYFGSSRVPPHYSLDGGASWAESRVYDEAGGRIDFSSDRFQLIFTSASKQFALVADPVTPKTFYGLTVSNFMVSTDGGASFRIPPGTGATFRYRDFFINAKMEAVPGRAGDLWLTSGHGDPSAGGYLYHSTDGGAHWQRQPVDKSYAIAIGKGAPGRAYALYNYGRPDAAKPWGVWRSDDEGATWSLISGSADHGYPFGSLNVPSALAASQDVEGLVYISFTGMSAGWGYQRAVGNPYPAR